MLRHPWLQGAFLGALALVWMIWHGRAARKRRPEAGTTANGGSEALQ